MPQESGGVYMSCVLFLFQIGTLIQQVYKIQNFYYLKAFVKFLT
jgi:hypothetical protein